MLRHIGMDYSAGAELHDDEHVGNSKECCVLREKITCEDLVAVIPDEYSPGLLIAR